MMRTCHANMPSLPGVIRASLRPLLLALFAMLLVFGCGRRGFFPFDQSIVFDGGWRIIAGQIPYRDFSIPFGPLVFWLQALFFRIGGVNYTSYLAHAAIINAVAALATVAIIHRVYPRQRLASWLGGGITAAWFYPPFGTPWAEQTAFACALTGLAALLYGLEHRGRIADAWIACGGALTVMSFAAKQNAGIFFMPLPALIILQRYLRDRRRMIRSALPWLAGGTVVVIGLAAWLWYCSDPGAFLRQFLEIPGELGKGRLQAVDRLFVKLFINAPGGTRLWRSAVVLVILASAVLIMAGIRHSQAPPGTLLMLLYTLAYQQIFYISSYNAYFNAQPFLGLVFGIGAGAIITSRRTRRIWLPRMITLALAILLMGAGMRIGWSRRVQDIFAGAEFHEGPDIPALKILQWASPTVVEYHDIRAAHLEELYQVLRKHNRPFFIFPDFTIMYGLLGQPPPQPLLWFHKGLTYPAIYDAQLDRRLLTALEAAQVEIIIIENESFFGTRNRLRDFPLLENWLRQAFTPHSSIGIFQVYRRSPSSSKP